MPKFTPDKSKDQRQPQSPGTSFSLRADYSTETDRSSFREVGDGEQSFKEDQPVHHGAYQPQHFLPYTPSGYTAYPTSGNTSNRTSEYREQLDDLTNKTDNTSSPNRRVRPGQTKAQQPKSKQGGVKQKGKLPESRQSQGKQNGKQVTSTPAEKGSEQVKDPNLPQKRSMAPKPKETSSVLNHKSSPLTNNTVPRYKVTDKFSTSVPGPPKPVPTPNYLAQAKLLPVQLTAPRPLLVILDLNGTLLVRPSRKTPHLSKLRPGVSNLMPFLFATCSLMVYSSSRTENAEKMARTLIPKIQPMQPHAFAAIWGREKLGLTKAQFNEKVQVYKRLEDVWADSTIQVSAPPGRRWDQTNTVLIDDSRLKAASQPHNLICIPEFSALHALSETETDAEQDIVATVKAQIDVLRWCSDVSGQIRRWQVGEIPLPILAKHKSRISTTEPDNTQFITTDYQQVLTTAPKPLSQDLLAEAQQKLARMQQKLKEAHRKLDYAVNVFGDDDDDGDEDGGVSLSESTMVDRGVSASLAGLSIGNASARGATSTAEEDSPDGDCQLLPAVEKP